MNKHLKLHEKCKKKKRDVKRMNSHENLQTRDEK